MLEDDLKGDLHGDGSTRAVGDLGLSAHDRLSRLVARNTDLDQHCGRASSPRPLGHDAGLHTVRHAKSILKSQTRKSPPCDGLDFDFGE